MNEPLLTVTVRELLELAESAKGHAAGPLSDFRMVASPDRIAALAADWQRLKRIEQSAELVAGLTGGMLAQLKDEDPAGWGDWVKERVLVIHREIVSALDLQGVREGVQRVPSGEKGIVHLDSGPPGAVGQNPGALGGDGKGSRTRPASLATPGSSGSGSGAAEEAET